MTAYTQPTQWTHALGNNADVSTLPDDTAGTTGLASLQKLFQLINQTPLAAGGVAPSREDFNALFKLLGESVFYMQKAAGTLTRAVLPLFSSFDGAYQTS